MKSVNPFNEEVIYEFTEITNDEINNKIELSQKVFLENKNNSFTKKKELMLKVANVLRTKKEEFAKILTLEMGKPITQAIAEVEKCAFVCDYYAENSEVYLSKEIVKTDASESYVQFDPLGVLLAVMPWNFPFWQVFRFAAPALMAGNTILLKHASNVCKSALLIEEIFLDAGFPVGSFQTLIISSSKVEMILNHKYIKAATLTGSEMAGKSVASICGNNLKKTVMELGGSDPFIVLDNTNIDFTVKTAVTARLINNGQSCIAAKRFIVVKDVYDEFVEKMIDAYSKIKIGNPLNPETDLGPLARADLREEIYTQVQKSVSQGAKILFGGEKLDMPGYFYKPTILAEVKKGNLAYSEELFGPVAILIKAEDENEAIQIANDTDFGLGASIWTVDKEKAKKIAGEINSGSVFINGMVKSDPRLPFGGVNISGYGRELSHYGIKEFVNIKTVWIA